MVNSQLYHVLIQTMLKVKTPNDVTVKQVRMTQSYTYITCHCWVLVGGGYCSYGILT